MEKIEKQLREALKEKLERTPQERRNEVFYASEAGYCPRKIYFSFIEKKPMEDLYGTFEVGDLLHEYLQKLFEETDKLPYAKVEVERNVMIWTPEFNISGRIDVYGIKEDGTREVWEIKSRSPIYWDVFNKPYPFHVAQLQLYLLAERVDYGYLAYINKNDMDIKVFKINKDEKLIKDIFLKFKKIQECIKKGKPPKEKGESWECKNCPYFLECALYDTENNEAGKDAKPGNT